MNSEFLTALDTLKTLTSDIKFAPSHNSRNGRVIITVKATGDINTDYEQATYTAGANRYFRRATPTRVFEQIIEQQATGEWQQRTITDTINTLSEQGRQTRITNTARRVLKHLPQTATAREFYEQCASELGEHASVAELRTALRSIMREQR